MITGANRGKYLKLLAICGIAYAIAVIVLTLLDIITPTADQKGWLISAAASGVLYHALFFKLVRAKFGRYAAYAVSIVITSTIVTLITLATGGIFSLNNIAMIILIFAAAMLGVGIAAALVWVQAVSMLVIVAVSVVDYSDIVMAASWTGLFLVALFSGWVLLVRPVRALEQESIDHLRKTLLDERLRSEGLISAIDDGIVIVSKEGVVRHANKQFLQMIDLRPEEMIDKTYREIVSQRVRIVTSSSSSPLISNNMAEVFRTGKPVTIDNETIEHINTGSRMDVSMSILPLKNEDDEINVVMLIARDITKLMDVQRMKDNFISLASHELRTPATVISGYADLLLNPMFGELSEKQRHYATRAKESTTRLIELVNDMLDMSRLESGQRANKPESVDLGAIIAEVIQTNQATTSQKQLTVKFDRATVAAYADKSRLQQVLDQLISNALQFAPVSTEIEVAAKKQLGTVRVSVYDRGPGIPEEKRQVIFDKFTKLDDSGEISGTGLGLAIAKKIVQDWGGMITVHARKGGGSEFSFTIPIPHKDAPKNSHENVQVRKKEAQ